MIYVHTRRGGCTMKNKMLDNIIKVLSLVAVVCAASPSRLNFYEPEKSESLK